MRIKRKPDPGRHHLILSLTRDALVVAHWVRNWLGWRQISLERMPLSGPEFSAEELHGLLRAWLARSPQAGQQSMPAGVAVSLVLPPEIGSLSLLDGDEPAETAIAGVLPFHVAETSHIVLPVGRRGKAEGHKALFWLHRDWTVEFQGLLGKLNLRLTEIFSRAQLFSPVLGAAKRQLQAEAVIEAEGERCVLHLYLPDGTPFRSAPLAVASGLPVAGQVRAELAAASARGIAISRLSLSGDAAATLAEPLRAAGLAPEMAVADDLGLQLGRLWQSPLEGLWFPPPRQELLRELNRWTIIAGAGGLVLFAALVWQTGEFEKEIGEAETAIRKLKPRYQKAVSSEKEAVQISETRRGLGDLERLPSPIDPVGQLAEGLPAGAWLTRFEYRGGQVRFAGYGLAPAEAVATLGKLPGFSGLREVAPPPVRDGQGTPFALDGRWAPETQATKEKGA